MKIMSTRSVVLSGVVVLFADLGCDPAQAAVEQRAGLVAQPAVQRGGPPVGQRWVLRDADGAAVNAVVEPTCSGNGPDCVVNEIGAAAGLTPECARLVWLDDQFVDLKFDLLTGEAHDCSPRSANSWDFGIFADAACAGPFYTTPVPSVETASMFTRRPRYIEAEQTLYYQGEQGLEQNGWYAGPDCVLVENDATQHPWVPVPQWAIDALPNPPYTFSWE